MILEPRIEPWLDHRRRSVCCESSTPLLTPVRYRRLLDVVEEANHALLEQLRGTFIVVGQAVVGEQVSIAVIEEQLRALDRRNELARGREVFRAPLVVLHHVDLEWNSRRPRAAELRSRESGGKQQRALAARARLGKLLRGHRAERESGIDKFVR